MAVYTHLSFADISSFVGPYSLGVLQAAHPIAEGIENTNYLLEFEDCRAILTLFEKRVRAEDLPFYMDFMAHLAHRGICCPAPYRAEGRAIRLIQGCPAVLISFLEGKGNAEPSEVTLFALGKEMAKMHLAASDFLYSRQNDFAPDHLHPLYEKTAQHLDMLRHGLQAEIAEEMEIMQRWPSLNLPRGVIHADLFRDNVFFDDHTMLSGIIDFYFSATDYFAYDLAIVMNAWDCHMHGTEALLRGYQALRPLSAAEQAALPFLARGAALRFLMTRVHDWFFRVEGAVVTPKDPLEYLHKWEYWRGVSVT